MNNGDSLVLDLEVQADVSRAIINTLCKNGYLEIIQKQVERDPFKNKNIDLKLATIISIFGVLGAIVGANLAIYTNVKDLKKYFRNFFSNYCYS